MVRQRKKGRIKGSLTVLAVCPAARTITASNALAILLYPKSQRRQKSAFSLLLLSSGSLSGPFNPQLSQQQERRKTISPLQRGLDSRRPCRLVGLRTLRKCLFSSHTTDLHPWPCPLTVIFFSFLLSWSFPGLPWVRVIHCYFLCLLLVTGKEAGMPRSFSTLSFHFLTVFISSSLSVPSSSGGGTARRRWSEETLDEFHGL